MRRTKSNSPAAAAMAFLTKSLTCVSVVLFMTGCRNTTNTPITPFGASTPVSPLSPVQGSASLSPIQQATGLSTLGAPTRVPPPPTGSYNSPGAYGATSNNAAPSNNYAPSGFAPSGASLGSSGLTRGLTNLSSPDPSVANSGFDNGVRQTSWVGAPSTGGAPPNNNNGFSGGPDPRLSPPAPQAPLNAPAASPRSGGMQVIDLTRSPYPPGYVPPQNRPGVGAYPNSAPQPQTAPQPQFNSAPQNSFSASPNSVGQPTNSTFVRSETGAAGLTSFESTSSDSGSAAQMASRPSNAMMPSTEPFQTDEDLQWRRPSPRF